MKILFLWLVLSTTALYSQTKLSYTYSSTVENRQVNLAVIQASFGPATIKKNTYLWEKYGPGYHYKILLKPRKITIRYTGKAKQMERRIKALGKKILR